MQIEGQGKSMEAQQRLCHGFGALIFITKTKKHH